jgi:hypothetical protein
MKRTRPEVFRPVVDAGGTDVVPRSEYLVTTFCFIARLFGAMRWFVKVLLLGSTSSPLPWTFEILSEWDVSDILA